MKITAKLQEFDLSGGSSRGRRYVNLDTNFGMVRQYLKPDVYNADNSNGEQREQTEGHVRKLRDAISNKRYTPTSFTATIGYPGQCTVEDGMVTLTLDENNPLTLLDGGHRYCALENIAREGVQARRKVDNLPIPLLVLLDPEERKEDFLNLNAGLTINRSHVLNLKLDTGAIDRNKLPYFLTGRELAKLSNNHPKSPFFRMVKFTDAGSAPIAFSQIVTDRKGDLLGSFFLSAKILEIMGLSNDWFASQFNAVFDLVKNKTCCAEAGKLLAVPPCGPKGCANLFLNVVNQFIYYLYLHNRTEPTSRDLKVLEQSLIMYNQEIGGDLGGKRKATAARLFAQSLFNNIANDEESNVNTHDGIPISLIVLTSPSCFGIETPARSFVSTTKYDVAEPINICADEVHLVKFDSDTDSKWMETP